MRLRNHPSHRLATLPFPHYHHHRTLSHTTPLHTPKPHTRPHHDLPTFLAHAARNPSSFRTSPTYTGTHYEYTVQSSLTRLGLSLARTGGAGDGGVDLRGTWRLPGRRRIRVAVQCKVLVKGRPGPSLVRELEGAVGGVTGGVWGGGMRGVKLEGDSFKGNEEGGQEGREIMDGSDIMALLVAPGPATKGVRDAMGRSRWPMGFVKVSLAGGVEQVLWNRRAAEAGLEGLGVVVRHRPPGRVEAGAGEVGRVEGSAEGLGAGDEESEARAMGMEAVLIWKGEPWEWRERPESEAVDTELRFRTDLDTQLSDRGAVEHKNQGTSKLAAAGG